MPVHRHTHNKLSSVLDINRESMLGGRPEPHRLPSNTDETPSFVQVAQSQILKRVPCVLTAASIALLFNLLFRLLVSQAHAHGDFNPRAGHFAVAHGRMPVAHMEQRARNVGRPLARCFASVGSERPSEARCRSHRWAGTSHAPGWRRAWACRAPRPRPPSPWISRWVW